ncbi:SDR family NAD(P)-dependent oxidoreductase [Pseudomonas rhodesiae]|uniref:SDR family NAD(P)-dependent oxidoreductase n=1 Tax=Pseudomonas rhodesiae TaxID=76760 RepID=UPI00241D021A|nr:SDR family oxidoreductase [Pseudomonas rhodesiae]
MNFTGKTAVVTGAGRGLGFSYAQVLATLGTNVVISDIGADKLGAGGDGSIAMEAAQTLRDKGFNVVGHHGDLSSEQGCEQLVATAIHTFDQLDILIHNAGWVGYQAIEEADTTFIGRAVDINIYTPLWLCKHAWKHLKQSAAPRVVLTSSDRAMYQQYARPGLVAYVVNAVSPVAKTRMWGVTGEPENLKPEWVTPGVVFLASQHCQDSGYVLRASNGQFTATRFVENPGVDYPVNLARVKATSAEQVAQLWDQIKEH